MIGISIEMIVALIAGLLIVLTGFTLYIVVERKLEDRRKRIESAYLIRNREGWYEYIRSDGMAEESLAPNNDAEVTAIEELFRTIVHNIKGEELERKISAFANHHLSKGYRKKLRGRNWGERLNALYRIHDFGVDSLAGECRELAKRTKSSEEYFLLLLIELKFYPDTFLDTYADKLKSLSSNDAKELFFGMPDEIFQKTVDRMENFDQKVQLSIIDVIGMKLDLSYVPVLEKYYSSTSSEMRIRVLKAYNALAVLPSIPMLHNSSESEIWQERYQVASLLSLIPKRHLLQFVKKFENDNEFLVREKVSAFEKSVHDGETLKNEITADMDTDRKGGE